MAKKSEAKFSVFSREIDEAPAIVRVANVLPSEMAGLPFLILAELEYRYQPNGLPAGGELNRVCRIDNQIVAALEPLGALYLGHLTFDGAMIVAFHSPAWAPESVKVKTGLLKNASIPLICREDPEWSWFQKQMGASPVDLEIAENAQLLRHLKSRGDLPNLERMVDFNFVLFEEANVRDFIKVATDAGFVAKDSAVRKISDDPPAFGCEMQLLTTVEEKIIAAHCATARRLAVEFQGVFDGWGCIVQN